jgi:hypothetical protein
VKLLCAFKKRVNHFRNELSVCGVGRADTVPLTQAGLTTRKRALSVRFIALATVILSLLAIEDAFRAAPPATPERDVVENYHGTQSAAPLDWRRALGRWIARVLVYAAAATARREGHVEILPAVKQPNRESFRRETNVVARLPEFSR